MKSTAPLIVTLALALGVAPLVGCGRGDTQDPPASSARAVPDPAAATAVAVSDTPDEPSLESRPELPPSAPEALGCKRAFVRGPQAIRTSAAGAGCAIHPKSASPSFMDDCDPVGWTSGCELQFGAQFCMNRQWTTMCQADADCPQGSRCTDGAIVGTIDKEYSEYGWCAPTCDPDRGKSACGRCDLQCEPDLEVCMRIDEPTIGGDEEAEQVIGPMQPKVRHKRAIVQRTYRPPAP